MFSLFAKLTSRTPVVREFPPIQGQENQGSNSNSNMANHNVGIIRMANPLRPPVWVEFRPRTETGGQEPRQQQQQRAQLWEQQLQQHMMQHMMRRAPHGTRQLLHNFGNWAAVYSFGPWTAFTANRRQLPFEIAEVKGRTPLLLYRSIDAPGFISESIHIG